MRLHIRAPCRATESLAKVKLAILNVFPDASFVHEDDIIEATCDRADTLRDLIRAQKIRDAARAELRRGLRDVRIEFSLNKQAAYAGQVSFGTGAAPLGDIEVELEDDRPDAAIDFLAESTVERGREEALR